MSAVNEVTDLTLEGDVAVITLDSPPVNALSFNVRDGLFEGFKAAIADPAAAAIVLICAGRTFIAGADISEFGGASKGASLFEVQAMMESSPKPVVAAIHGTALGGGLEVALCAHYRIAVPSAKCGLPEVNLGLLPGAGGTQRLPRIAGPRQALEMMTSGDARAGAGVPGDGPRRRAGRRGQPARRRRRLRPAARRRAARRSPRSASGRSSRCRPTSSPRSAPPTPGSSAASRRRRRSSRRSRRR